MRICIAHFRVITQGTFRLIGSPDVSCIPIHLGSWFFLIHNSVFSQGSIWRHNWGFRFLWFWLKFFGYFFCWSSIRRFALFFKKRRKLLKTHHHHIFTIPYKALRKQAACRSTTSEHRPLKQEGAHKRNGTAQLFKQAQCLSAAWPCLLVVKWWSCGKMLFLLWHLPYSTAQQLQKCMGISKQRINIQLNSASCFIYMIILWLHVTQIQTKTHLCTIFGRCKRCCAIFSILVYIPEGRKAISYSECRLPVTTEIRLMQLKNVYLVFKHL